MIKKGDRVRRKKIYQLAEWTYGDQIFTVEYVYDHQVMISGKWWSSEYFEIAEEYKLIQSGKFYVNIYSNKFNNEIHYGSVCRTREGADKAMFNKHFYTKLETIEVDWTTKN